MHKTLFETLLAAAVTWPFRPDLSRLLLPNAKEPLDAQAELRAAVTKTVETFGPLDIFVSNAGILTMGTIDTYSLEDFDRMVAINVRAALHRSPGSRPRNEKQRANPHYR